MGAQLPGFSSFQHKAGGITHDVFVRGQGPGLVLIHELPAITPALLTLAEVLVDAGFEVFLPSLLGEPGKRQSPLSSVEGAWELCTAREFRATLGDGETRPVVVWLRSLVGEVVRRNPPKVGVMGLCFSGGFALGAAVESSVAGAVACEPSLPFNSPRRLGVGAPDISRLNARVQSGDLALRAYRFEGDRISPCERMLGLGAALPDRIEGRCIPDDCANPQGPKWPPHHSVVTTHLIDNAGEPTRQARDEIIAFFRWRLSDGPPVGPSPTNLRDCLTRGCRRGRSV